MRAEWPLGAPLLSPLCFAYSGATRCGVGTQGQGWSVRGRGVQPEKNQQPNQWLRGVLLLLTDWQAEVPTEEEGISHGPNTNFTLNKLECFTQAARPQRIRLAWDKQPTTTEPEVPGDKEPTGHAGVPQAEGVWPSAAPRPCRKKKHCRLPEGVRMAFPGGAETRAGRPRQEGADGTSCWDHCTHFPAAARVLAASAQARGGGARTGQGHHGARRQGCTPDKDCLLGVRECPG
jgi:hypothetical protein